MNIGKIKLIFLGFLLECHFLCFVINCNYNNIVCHKFERLHTIVSLIFCVGPTATIRTYHVSSMANSTEIEPIVLTNYYIFMAHSYCYPIWSALFDFEGNSFNFRAFLKVGFHDSKFITCRILTFNNMIGNKLDVIMF